MVLLGTCWDLHIENLWGISLGTLWEHTWNMMGTQDPKNSKIPLGNELLSAKGEKIGPPRCRLSCHFNWLHENLISIKLIVTIFGQGHYPFLKVCIPIYMALQQKLNRSNKLNASHFLMQKSRCLLGCMTLN